MLLELNVNQVSNGFDFCQSPVVSPNGHAPTKPRYPEIVFERLTSKQLDEGDFSQEYIIPNVIPAGQGGVISARFKSLKTTIGIAAAFSASTGRPFLGKFPVANPCRAGVMSGESGLAALRGIGRRVAASFDMTLADATDLFWSPTVPKLTDRQHLVAVEDFIKHNRLGLLLIDPTYLAFGDAAEFSANVYAMGRYLLPVTEIIARTGCTIILINHNRKSRSHHQKQDDPPELGEISGSGYCEWARFWMLLGPRREWNSDTGQHWLWLRTGGSSVDSGLWAVDVREGRRGDSVGQQWDVAVTPAAEARLARDQEKSRRKAEDKERIASEREQKLLDALTKLPNGDTANALRAVSKLNAEALAVTIRSLMAKGLATTCSVEKGGCTYSGYIATNQASSVKVGQGQSKHQPDRSVGVGQSKGAYIRGSLTDPPTSLAKRPKESGDGCPVSIPIESAHKPCRHCGSTTIRRKPNGDVYCDGCNAWLVIGGDEPDSEASPAA